MGLLAVLCAALGVLEYRWIGEITGGERNRLREELHSRLSAASEAFDRDILASTRALVPASDEIEHAGRDEAYAAQYVRWRAAHGHLFRRIALAIPEESARELDLHVLDVDSGSFTPGEWPSEWEPVRERLERRLSGPGGRGGGRPPSGPDSLIEIPRFAARAGPAPEQEWLLLEPDLDFIRGSLLPQLLSRFLSDSERSEYDIDLVERDGERRVIFHSLPDHEPVTTENADESTPLFDIRLDGPQGPGRFGGRGGRGGFRGGPPPGRWLLLVRNRAGSLEALVEGTRRRNLGVSLAVLLLILGTGGMLVRLSRRSEQLAQTQINFVAGVSHELRTPLTVIRTAAYNLRNATFRERPDHLERYGKLIEDEAEKLEDLVEQVLQFASAEAGHPIRDREAVPVTDLIEDEIESRRIATGTGVTIEGFIAPGLPPVHADPRALRHALRNLIDNALKYGIEGSNWIGIYAEAAGTAAVQIRVADRGPGIPPDEQARIFDPFFRGRRALADQAHGTGLGLNLVKTIVEAHGGTVGVKSASGKGTEFTLVLPAASEESES